MNETSAPGPGARIQRTAGQVGAVSILIQFIIAFDWFEAGSWTVEQSAAVMALAAVVASALQNVLGHFRTQQVAREVLEWAAAADAEEEAAPKRRRPLAKP